MLDQINRLLKIRGSKAVQTRCHSVSKNWWITRIQRIIISSSTCISSWVRRISTSYWFKTIRTRKSKNIKVWRPKQPLHQRITSSPASTWPISKTRSVQQLYKLRHIQLRTRQKTQSVWLYRSLYRLVSFSQRILVLGQPSGTATFLSSWLAPYRSIVARIASRLSAHSWRSKVAILRRNTVVMSAHDSPQWHRTSGSRRRRRPSSWIAARSNWASLRARVVEASTFRFHR